MFQIAICDDEIAICSQLEQTILNYAKIMKESIEVDVFYSGEELYRFLNNGLIYDMIFLDIELKKLNGIELGLKIREELNNESIQIVFISDKENYAMRLFEVRPMNFLIKPLNDLKIEKVVEKGIELTDKKGILFSYKQGHTIKKILIKDILFFESMNRQVRMITLKGECIFYGQLSKIYSELCNYHFFYIHKSFLINYDHVIEFNYNYLIMSNKTVLPISQSKRKEVREMQIKLEEGDI